MPALEAYHGCVNDLQDRYRPAIAQRAYELYQSGINGNADADWLAAKAEIFRTELTRER